jgi:hypothetical protein
MERFAFLSADDSNIVRSCHATGCGIDQTPCCSMKSVIFIVWLLMVLNLAGCVSSGSVHNASPITAKPFDLDLILVKCTSSLKDLAVESQVLNDKTVSGLRDSQMFKEVAANQADLGVGSGITINAQIVEIIKVSKNKRLWAGAMAGRAKIRIQVRVSDLNSGHQIETFEAAGESSGGSALAGTTDEAIERAADEIVGQILKINVQTAE